MGEMKHSIEQAVEIQRVFEERYAGKSGVVGIGIGLNEARDDLALNVQVARPAEAAQIPPKFRGLEVVIDIVGTVEAF